MYNARTFGFVFCAINKLFFWTYFSGYIFISFVLWWMINLFNLFHLSISQENGRVFISTFTYLCFCFCGLLKNFEVEGFIKILTAVTGIVSEMTLAYSSGIFDNLENGQHATMYFFFGLSGFIDILAWY